MIRLSHVLCAAAVITTWGGSGCAPVAWVFVEASMKAKVDSLFNKQSLPFETLAISNNPDLPNLQAASQVFRALPEAEAFFSNWPEWFKRMPTPDFPVEVGIVVAFGPQHTGMISGEIVAVEDQGQRLVVHSIRWMPPEGSLVTGDVGEPFHYIAITLPNKPIEFSPVVDAFWTLRPANKEDPRLIATRIPDGPVGNAFGREWGNPYVRKDGTHVRGYCRKVSL